MDKARFFEPSGTTSGGPLEGVRVVEATTTWAGPMAGCILADYGAEVTKVELPEGEVARLVPPALPGTKGLSFMHQTVNRNKRSVTLELRRPEGKELFLGLAARSDILIQNFRPGTMERWGLGYEQVRAVKPDIVYLSISGFGQYGPLAARPGYDPLAQATSGWNSLNGEVQGGPVKAPSFLADDLGGLHGALSAMAALRHRDRTGEGQHVDVALLDAMLFQSSGNLTLGALGAPLERMGNQFALCAPTNFYPCRDGYVMAGVLLDSHWRRLTRLIGRPELAEAEGYRTNAERVARRDEVDGLLRDWCAERTRREIVEIFAENELPAAPVHTYAEAAAEPHVRERDMLQETELEDGSSAPLTGPAAKFSRTPARVRSAAPRLGAHTAEVLGELGVDGAELERLRREGVV